MSGLLGPDGKPISSASYMKKAPSPKTGEQFGLGWSGPNAGMQILSLPGGGAIQFDLNQLTLAEYRQMTDHYQVNSSLTVLMFLLHQIEWDIDCEDKKQRDFYREQLEQIWTPFVRSKSTAFWSGFSPNILQWGNDTANRRITLEKIKDLMPEDALVNWKTVDGAGTRKLSVYDGIKTLWGDKIPVENTYWYPLLMQNGNYYGKKLLRSAFQPWFFSILVHLFANRYYERFGEPTPVGRAPYEDDIRYNGVEMKGNQAMELILNGLRSRAVVVLPNDRTPVGDESNPEFDYQIEYLESQMRGADFERYMTRLDEEMSLALFTPILMMRTADVGSYNLGTQHYALYQALVSAIAGDWKFYVDWYLLRPLRDFNFGPNAPMPKWKPRKMGRQNQDFLNEVAKASVAGGKAKPDYDELGEMAGLTLTEVKELTADPESDPEAPPTDPNGGDDATENSRRAREVARNMRDRVATQVAAAYRRESIKQTEFDLGFQRQFEAALSDLGYPYPHTETKDFYSSLKRLLNEMATSDIYDSADSFMSAFDMALNWRVDQVYKV